jgi:hypothetical protein
VHTKTRCVQGAGGAAAAAVVFGTATGYLTPMTGRLWSLIDPTYAKNNIPIIASGETVAAGRVRRAQRVG